ncbi:MAG: hypothetical protein JWQ25_1345 [Daejeonella sp.]|nr:hypothetical protein [Daejeonella sp.]
MNSTENKQLMQGIFYELSKGNDKPFIEAMADDMQWIWMGSGQWSKTFKGKNEVLGELWSAVRQTLEPPYRVFANNFIADGDYVTVEAVGQNLTPDGKTYHNKYCWVCQIVDGKICELKEYMDTDLVTRTFTEKAFKIIGGKFRVDFGMAKAILYFQNETSLQFTIIEKDGKPYEEVETVEIKLTEIRPNLYIITWKERNQNTVTQIQDFNEGIVYSNWTLPNGEFMNVKGAILPITI